MGYRNPELCKQCGGDCCRIYSAENWPRNRDLEDWMDWFHAERESYGVEPRFDPLQVRQPGHEYRLQELREQGLDPEACEYLGPEGCLIPWETRPAQCRKFRCNKDPRWEALPST